jgi:hypothetical protein
MAARWSTPSLNLTPARAQRGVPEQKIKAPEWARRAASVSDVRSALAFRNLASRDLPQNKDSRRSSERLSMQWLRSCAIVRWNASVLLGIVHLSGTG